MKETHNEKEEIEEEEEGEEFPNKKRLKKIDLTDEQIKEKYNLYLNCKLKYPKSQFCFFYFKGTCLLGNKCQFCHGYDEFSMDRFFTFLKDKDAVEKSSQRYYQKFYFNRIIPPEEYTYDNLMEFQKNHPGLFKKIYTFEELKKSRKKRLEIRRLLTKDIIEKFITELFNKYKHLKADELSSYIYNVGYPQSIKLLLKETKLIFCKNIKEGNKNVCYFIKNLTPEEMMNRFVQIIIEYMKNGKYEDFFPIDYSQISKIIFTNNQIDDPNITTYLRQKNINEKIFIEILVDKLLEESNKGNFDLIKNKTKEELMQEKLSEIVLEDIYNTHFKINNTNFCYFNFDEIESFFVNKKYIKKKINQIKYELYKDGNLFFFSNGDNFSSFNYKKFNSFNIEDVYSNNFYYKNCFNENEKKENEIVKINNNSSENIINEVPTLSPNNIYKIEDTVIKFINDENSLKFFKNQSTSFEVLSIDIEGDFDSKQSKINLIQICDDTNLKNDIYVVDFITFKKMNDNNYIELSKLLKKIFENKNIKKIFFDGRSDLLALHQELEICVKNFIDLSSLYNAVNSYREQYQFKILKGEKDEKEFSKCINLCRQNYFFKGLNTVLKNYHSEHCTNPLKNKYHKIFKEHPFEYWTQRPILQEFLLYSALDVKYEYNTYYNLKIELKKILSDFYEIKDISDNNIDLIILLISCGNHNAACESYKKRKKDVNEIK